MWIERDRWKERGWVERGIDGRLEVDRGRDRWKDRGGQERGIKR